jgi:L-ascorbate metabolism protein UlaG (beta-lactamase superfamily)
MAEIIWIGHASVLLRGERTVYIDPWQVKDPQTADLVLVTHDHYDHLSEPDIRAVSGAGTEILVPAGYAEKLQVAEAKVTGVRPGQEITAAGLKVEVVASYNVGKFFHPEGAGNVGYVVTIDGERIYHAGDTDRIPEMKGLAPDVALLPVGGTYTMTADEAAQAVADLGAKRAIPIHYGTIVGTRADAEAFKKRCGVPVEILDPQP